MDKAKILNLAREAGFDDVDERAYEFGAASLYDRTTRDKVLAFARLVAEAEREACAKVCDLYYADNAEYLAQAIRSRTE